MQKQMEMLRQMQMQRRVCRYGPTLAFIYNTVKKGKKEKQRERRVCIGIGIGDGWY